MHSTMYWEMLKHAVAGFTELECMQTVMFQRLAPGQVRTNFPRGGEEQNPWQFSNLWTGMGLIQLPKEMVTRMIILRNNVFSHHFILKNEFDWNVPNENPPDANIFYEKVEIWQNYRLLKPRSFNRKCQAISKIYVATSPVCSHQ